ncbi:Uma2 family endonuclease [Spirulina major CS-329]|uniref:Uma2 family endonuclease n=1 Tax=Spirulina TaxID=1154 RepID=UPI00232ABA51|nr:MULTISPECIES: Uma2 family endonuclease [Spirulina]MDB9496959.1 Uma2 family endonuclease [Spirulina subsalsa CS-330]MDB9502350.1 Uma2 family endonuclease [Spirulina major CS-329]
MVTLQLCQLDIPPGQRLLIHTRDWAEFEAILTELGEKRSSRIAYSNGRLEIRMPLPKHERAKSMIGDMIKILLEELEMDCEYFGSITFKRQEMNYGIEPDDCFYIQNHHMMIGKERLNLAIDPPPDLAIEVDVTSKTQLEAYTRLGVPELWIYDRTLTIYVLRSGEYQPSDRSPTFPDLPILDWVAEALDHSGAIGRSPALRAFRQKLRQ